MLTKVPDLVISRTSLSFVNKLESAPNPKNKIKANEIPDAKPN